MTEPNTQVQDPGTSTDTAIDPTLVAPAADPAASQTPPTGEPPAPSPSSDPAPANTEPPASIPMHRFNAVYKRMKAAEYKLEEATQGQAPPAAAQPNAPKAEPQWEEYEAAGKSVEDFNSDWVNHKVSEGLQTAKAAEKAQAAQKAMQKRQTDAGINFQAKAAKARAAHPDFDTVLGAADQQGIQFSPEINLAISEHPDAGELAYQLVKNPEAAYKLMTLSPEQALFELGRVAATMASGNGQPDPKLTNIGNPPIPMNGGVNATPSGFRDGMSDAEFDQAFPFEG